MVIAGFRYKFWYTRQRILFSLFMVAKQLSARDRQLSAPIACMITYWILDKLKLKNVTLFVMPLPGIEH